MKQRTSNKQRQEIMIYTQSVAPLPRASRYMIHVCWLVIYAAAIVRRGLVVIVRSGLILMEMLVYVIAITDQLILN